VIGDQPVGQGCQAITYVPNAVPSGAGTQDSCRWASPSRPRISRSCRSRMASRRPGSRRPPVSRCSIRVGASAAGRGYRGLSPIIPTCSRSPNDPHGGGALEPAGGIHDEPGQALPLSTPSPDPTSRAGRGQRATPLPGDRSWDCCAARSSRSGPGEVRATSSWL